MKDTLREVIVKVVDKEFSMDSAALTFAVDYTDNPEHGDYSTNIAMQLTKQLKKNPREIAQHIVNNFSCDFVEKVEIAGPGFINFFVKHSAFHNWLGQLLQSDRVLRSNIGQGKKMMVEFVSANPTGPLHVGHGRGAAIGDTIAAIMDAVGYDVHREYYVNDAGNQMNKLAKSIYARYCELHNIAYDFPEDGYKGDYIFDIAKGLSDSHKKELSIMTTEQALAVCKRVGIDTILKSIDDTLKRFNVNFDNYFSETSLYENGDVEKALDKLNGLGAVYEKDGAVWLSTKVKGDDEDRVLRKSDGSYTYFMPDIAYHNNKLTRDFELLVDLFGADHHGYVKRMECAIDYLGYTADRFHAALIQMVSLIKDGQKVTMSTRAGEFITLDWLIEEVGVDAARFFYNMRSANAQFDFDIDLAKSRSSDNPVYYVQYAHARVCSLISNATEKGIPLTLGDDLEKLTLDVEKNIIKKMAEFPYMLRTAAKYNEPHRVAYYLQELAGEFHGYYYNNIIINEEAAQITNARIGLCKGVAIVIKFGLELLGVSAPERM